MSNIIIDIVSISTFLVLEIVSGSRVSWSFSFASSALGHDIYYEAREVKRNFNTKLPSFILNCKPLLTPLSCLFSMCLYSRSMLFLCLMFWLYAPLLLPAFHSAAAVMIILSDNPLPAAMNNVSFHTCHQIFLSPLHWFYSISEGRLWNKNKAPMVRIKFPNLTPLWKREGNKQDLQSLFRNDWEDQEYQVYCLQKQCNSSSVRRTLGQNMKRQWQ